ncbi:sensor histidine kinase [Ornithinicoccus halotolerans]|uniref:sensor histidine kinase n=1 Tax=Ornithinicoccus halotolerans TaxID=1748220 RepID=UPI00188637D6|nr:sensor histidine kinase [Ornithinicoccus halotolerans]
MTALILWTPYLGFVYRSPSLHLMLDTVDACVAFLAAYLVYGRFVRARTLQDLLLAEGLVLLAVAGVGLTYFAGPLAGQPGGAFHVWLPLTVRLIGAVLIALAALSRSRRRTGRSAGVWLVLGPVVLVTAVVMVLAVLGSRLPTAVGQAYVPPAVQPPLLTGHPLFILAQGASAICFGIASIAFTAQAVRRGDALLRWLGPACALGACARVHYALFPSLYTDWLYTGDLLRTGFYLLLLVGAARELSQYWNAQTKAAVLEDRRRLARELHDGVIQELAYIRLESHGIPVESPARGRITHACDRALDEARAAVHALDSSGTEPLGFRLHRAATELAERYAVDLEVDLDDSVDALPHQQHALTRITREAVSNAARHGKAARVVVRLSREGGCRRLSIQDDGRGFDVGTASTSTGYGLTSMRDRASALPGSFRIDASTGTGSVVTVTW